MRKFKGNGLRGQRHLEPMPFIVAVRDLGCISFVKVVRQHHKSVMRVSRLQTDLLGKGTSAVFDVMSRDRHYN